MLTESSKLVVYLPTNKALIPSNGLSIIKHILNADREGLSVSVQFVDDAEWKRLTK